MKTLIFALTSATLILLGVKYVMDAGSAENSLEDIAFKVNQDKTSTWKATVYPNFTYSQEQLKKMFSLKVEDVLPEGFSPAPYHDISIEDLPENFDAREKWSSCSSIKEVRDQSACGSCWAFGAVSAMSDRICIKSNQKDQRRVSSEDLLECCTSCGFGCNGGMLYASWSYWKTKGIVTGDLYGDTKYCKPYAFAPCNHHSSGPYDDCSKHDYDTPRCKKECTNGEYEKSYDEDKTYGKNVYTVAGEHNIMKELVKNGPIEAAFTVYNDFLVYKSGVYSHRSGGALGGHAIRIIGYGVENGVKYWLCVNSWNESWGEKGTFKILRGSNHCGIESEGVAGLPKL